MQIDTSSIHSEASTGVLQCSHTSALDNAELVTAESAVPTRGDDFTAILEHLDGLFKPLLDATRAQLSGATAKTAAEIPQMPELSGGPSPEDIAERDRFLAMLDQGPTQMNDSAYVVPGSEAMTRLAQPRRGVGAPVFVGLDAEWDRHSDGRNKLLSVQLYLIGPTGERLSKVIDVHNGEDRQSRPSLAETLEDLLDEAEVHCIFDEWPSEVILCGFFTRADIPVLISTHN